MKRFSILAIALLIGLTSCQKAMDEMSQLDFARAFMPPSFRYETVQAPYRGPNEDQPTIMLVTTTLRWNASPNIVGYRLQFSYTDPTFQDLSQVTDLNIQRTYHVIDRPVFGASYYARIMAIAHSGQEDSRWNYLNFQIANEQLFLPLRFRGENQDVFATRARVRWHAYSAADRIEIRRLNNGNVEDYTVVETINIAPADDEHTFYNLDFDTQFAVAILEGDHQRGQLVFSTNRGFHDDDPNVVWMEAGQNLSLVLQNEANIGRVIFLPTGFEATITDPIPLAGTMHIFGDADGERPRIIFNNTGSNELIRLPEHRDDRPMEHLIFENVEILGTPNPDGSFRNNVLYIINQGGSNTNFFTRLETLRFENTVIANFGNNAIRFQGTAGQHIENIIVNNSIVHRMGLGASGAHPTGTYAFVNTNVANGRVDNILITNSTFYNMSHSLINVVGAVNTRVNERVTIENSTFDRIIGDGGTRYLIDGGTHSSIEIQIRNVIFGSTFDDAARGIRISPTSPAIVVENSFQTEDWVTTNPEGENFDIPEVREFRGPRAGQTGLFMQPNAGDFRIRPTVTFPGRYTAGDPQWRP